MAVPLPLLLHLLKLTSAGGGTRLTQRVEQLHRDFDAASLLQVHLHVQHLEGMDPGNLQAAAGVCSARCEVAFVGRCLPSVGGALPGLSAAERHDVCRRLIDSNSSEHLLAAGCVPQCASTAKMLATQREATPTRTRVPATGSETQCTQHCEEQFEACARHASTLLKNWTWAFHYCRGDIDFNRSSFLWSAGCMPNCASSPGMISIQKRVPACSARCERAFVNACFPSIGRLLPGLTAEERFNYCRMQIDSSSMQEEACEPTCASTSKMLATRREFTPTWTRMPATGSEGVCSQSCQEKFLELSAFVHEVLNLTMEWSRAYKYCRDDIDFNRSGLLWSAGCRPNCISSPNMLAIKLRVPSCSARCEGGFVGNCVPGIGQAFPGLTAEERHDHCRSQIDIGEMKEEGCVPKCASTQKMLTTAREPTPTWTRVPTTGSEGYCSQSCEEKFRESCGLIHTVFNLTMEWSRAYQYSRDDIDFNRSGLLWRAGCRPSCASSPDMLAIKQQVPTCSARCEWGFVADCVPAIGQAFPGLTAEERHDHCRSQIDAGEMKEEGCAPECAPTPRMLATRRGPTPTRARVPATVSEGNCSRSCEALFRSCCAFVHAVFNLTMGWRRVYQYCRDELDLQRSEPLRSAGCRPHCASTPGMLALSGGQPSASAAEPRGGSSGGSRPDETRPEAPVLPPQPWTGGQRVGDYVRALSKADLQEFMVESGSGLPRRPSPWFYSPMLDGQQGALPEQGFDLAARRSETDGSRHYGLHLQRFINEQFQAGWARYSPGWKSTSYLVRGNEQDAANFGDVFLLSDWDPFAGTFSLKTWFGTHLYLEADGSVSGNRSEAEYQTMKGEEQVRLQARREAKAARREGTTSATPVSGFRFRLVDHPFKRKPSQYCLIPAERDVSTPEELKRATQTCIGVERPLDQPGIGVMDVTNGTSCATALEAESAGFLYVKLRSCYGALSVELGSERMLGWLGEMHRAYPWEMRVQEDMQSFQNQRDMRSDFPQGWVAGLVLSLFLALVVHNVWFAFADGSPTDKVRFTEFDVARFILETMVVYSHMHFVYLQNRKEHWMASYRMPAFIFISGIFGSSMEWRSVSVMWCYTLGTTVLLVLMRALEREVVHGPSLRSPLLGEPHAINNAAGAWFIACLFVWRTAVTPLFHLSRRAGLRPGAFLAAFWVACWLLMHWTRNFSAWIFGNYNWKEVLNFGPVFAAGLLCSAAQWDALFKRRAIQAGCLAYFVLWHLLALAPPVLRFNRNFCLPTLDAKSCYHHYYVSAFDGHMDLGSFSYDLIMYVLRMGITLSFVGLVYPFTELLGRRLPKLGELMAGWGSRTMYCYILHLHVVRVLCEDGFLQSHETEHWCRLVKWVVPIPLAVFINITFSSKGTERLLRWLVVPLWIKAWLGWFCIDKHILEKEWTWCTYLFPSKKPQEPPVAPVEQAIAAAGPEKLP